MFHKFWNKFCGKFSSKLYDAALATVEKEIRRSSRGYCKARISFIRAEIRGFRQP